MSYFLGTYVPEAVIVTLNLPSGETHVITGAADGEFLSISREQESVTFRRGVKGSMRTRWLHRDLNISLSLLQTSQSNDVLTRILQADENAMDNSELFGISIIDKSGRTTHYSGQAFITSMPDHGFSTEGDTRTWTLYAADAQSHLGGGDQIASENVDLLESYDYTVPDSWKP